MHTCTYLGVRIGWIEDQSVRLHELAYTGPSTLGATSMEINPMACNSGEGGRASNCSPAIILQPGTSISE